MAVQLCISAAVL